MTSNKLKIMSFASVPALRAWLAKNHVRSEGILLRIYKKESGIATVGYAEALEYSWALSRLHWSHPDFLEGPRAFVEKREPNWVVD